MLNILCFLVNTNTPMMFVDHTIEFINGIMTPYLMYRTCAQIYVNFSNPVKSFKFV